MENRLRFPIHSDTSLGIHSGIYSAFHTMLVTQTLYRDNTAASSQSISVGNPSEIAYFTNDFSCFGSQVLQYNSIDEMFLFSAPSAIFISSLCAISVAVSYLEEDNFLNKFFDVCKLLYNISGTHSYTYSTPRFPFTYEAKTQDSHLWSHVFKS